MTPLHSFMVIFSSTAFYGVLHSWLASLRLKARLKANFGEIYTRFYRLGYNFFAVVSFLPIVYMVAFFPNKVVYTIPSPWVSISFILQLISVAVVGIGLLQTGLGDFSGVRQFFHKTPPQKTPLVRGGLYKWVRHPLYTAGMLFIWLTPQMTCNILALNLALTAYLILGATVEERKLVQLYGDEYRDYQENTPMFFPRLPTLKKSA